MTTRVEGPQQIRPTTEQSLPTRTAVTAEPQSPTRFRVPARLRIVAWIVFTAAIGLLVLVVTVQTITTRRVAEEANAQVAQEMDEFGQFAREGRDPLTAKPFASLARLGEVYLTHQTPGDHELMFFNVPGPGGNLLESRGQALAESGQDYDLLDDSVLMAEILAGDSGVAQTPAGELRWARTAVRAGTEQGSFVVVSHVAPAMAGVVHTLRLMSLISLAVLCLIAGISWLVAGQILRPVREVTEAAASISQEDLSGRIPISSHDDIGNLTVQFNAMLDRLEEAFETQQRFVNDASHELRTPITVIRGHLELMGDDPAERAATVALATTELDRMSRIVGDLLNLAKAERPDFVLPRRGVDLAELTLDIDAKMQALGERRWFLSGIAEGTATLDPERITQAVLQLAQNAVQHTAEGSTIELRSRMESDHRGRAVVFSITDQGPGVHPDDLDQIFGRFRRGRNHDRSSGAGLGLPIVQAIATAHRGEAFVRSVYGQGATFGIRVPLRPGDLDQHDDHDAAAPHGGAATFEGDPP